MDSSSCIVMHLETEQSLHYLLTFPSKIHLDILEFFLPTLPYYIQFAIAMAKKLLIIFIYIIPNIRDMANH